jgi:hypothetical protein
LDQQFTPIKDQLQEIRDNIESSSNSIKSILYETSLGVAGLDQKFVSIGGNLSAYETEIRATHDGVETIRQEVDSHAMSRDPPSAKKANHCCSSHTQVWKP